MVTLALVGPAIMGLVLLVVVLVLARGIDWRSNEIFTESEDEGNLLGNLASSPVVWVVVFLSFALGSTAVVLAAVGGFGVTLPGGLALAVAPFAVLLLAYLVGGTYAAVRDRNVSPAGATLAAALVVAVLLLVAITVQLLAGP